MHMADALLSPVTGGVFWALSGSLIGYSAKKIAQENDSSRIPLMGVMGAFIFAAQMINFSIPGTGSSGHLGGGLLLAVILGPYRAFITLSSVLVIQCLFFADGGLLALGCNIFNMAFFPSFIAYPLIYKTIAGTSKYPLRIGMGCIFAAEIGLLLGATSVVLQTVASGITELPFRTFILFMLPIHSAIGIVEGLVTWGVISFVLKTDPMLLVPATTVKPSKMVVSVFIVGAIITGAIVSSYASPKPDGLEWSIGKVNGTDVITSVNDKVHKLSESLQQRIAFLPDYSFRASSENDQTASSSLNFSTVISGIIGSAFVMIVAVLCGLAVRRKITKVDARS